MAVKAMDASAGEGGESENGYLRECNGDILFC